MPHIYTRTQRENNQDVRQKNNTTALKNWVAILPGEYNSRYRTRDNSLVKKKDSHIAKRIVRDGYPMWLVRKNKNKN